VESRRGIATVLFTDIVGSTERATALGDRGWRDVLRAHHAAVRQELRRHHGHEIATAGDGFLAVFDSPAHALLCAAAIRDAVRDIELSVRCGLHMGEVEREEGSVGGIAVHIGARVAALAAPDEILVSGTVRDAETGSAFGFEDRGRHALKGVTGEWRIHALTEVPEEEVAALPPPPPEPGAVRRLRVSRVAPVVGIYLAVAAAVFLLTLLLRSALELPDWIPGVALLLLGVGLIVIAATAWVQAHPQTALRRARGELPGSREVDLRGMARAVTRGELPHLTWGRAIAGGALAFAILFGAAGFSVLIQERGQSFAPDEALADDAAPGIAVLPFSVQGAGLDVWREGAVDLIGSNLDGAAGLRAIDSRTLLARWREAVRDGEEPDLATSLAVARRTGARYALVGSAVALGRDLRLTADIYELAGGKSLGQAQVQGSQDSVYMLVDQLSIEALQAILGGKAGDLPRVELARVTTASLPALKAYLEGEVLFRKADWTGALSAYQEAVEADSTFALAWRRVAESIGWLLPEDRPGGQVEAANEAARWSERLPERESVLVLATRAYSRGSMTMLEPLKAAARRYPDDPELLHLLAEHYAHAEGELLVDPAETERTYERLLELDPTFAPPYQHAIEYAFYRGDSARSLDLLSTFERLVGDTREARHYRLAATLAWGSPSERSTALAAIDTLPARGIPPCHMFAAPRFADLQLACARATLENGGNALSLFWASLRTGRIETFHEVLRAGRGFSGPFEVSTLHYLRQRDLPVDGDRLREAAAPAPTSFWAAALAAEDGRTDGVRAFQEIAGALRDSMVAEGDSLGAGIVEGRLRTIEGYVALQRGERERALALLVEGQRKWSAPAPNRTVRWTIADLLVDLGRPEEAIPYYRSFRFDPFAAVELGKIYAGLGRVDQAKEQYETALAHWRDADPVLAPRVADVRQRLAGLGLKPRG
jgi:class 3 adenylate cyclase/tetratricopeptide (TPR) repeat protein